VIHSFFFWESAYRSNQVLSSVIAAWSDISSALSAFALVNSADPVLKASANSEAAIELVKTVGSLNAGYFWMLFNCLMNAAYVLTMRKRIKSLGFKVRNMGLFTEVASDFILFDFLGLGYYVLQ
jgi:hypothetical protein